MAEQVVDANINEDIYDNPDFFGENPGDLSGIESNAFTTRRERELEEQIKELANMLDRERQMSREVVRNPVSEAIDVRCPAAMRDINKILDVVGRGEKDIVVGVYDFDYFKNINDVYGHGVGDEVIKAFHNAQLKALRSYDEKFWMSPEMPETSTQTKVEPFSYGGDEGALILPFVSKEQLPAIMQRITGNMIEELGLLREQGLINDAVVDAFTFKAYFFEPAVVGKRKNGEGFQYESAEEIVAKLSSSLKTVANEGRNTIIIEGYGAFPARSGVTINLKDALVSNMTEEQKKSQEERYNS